MLYRPFGHYSQTFPSLSRVFSKYICLRGRSHSSKHLNKTSPPCVCVIFISFWNANDKWCSEKKKKKSSYLTIKSIKKRVITALLVDHSGDLICSSVLFWGFRGSQWVWTDLKNNEVDVLFYQLNNEVVCFREPPPQLPPPPSTLFLTQRDHPPTLLPLWWSWYMHKQHFHEVPSIVSLEIWCPIHCMSNTLIMLLPRVEWKLQITSTKLGTGKIDFIWILLHSVRPYQK